MKSVANSINEIQQELEARMNWMSLAVSMMNFAVKHGMTEELKKSMLEHAKKGEME